MCDTQLETWHMIVSGRVQGVGFRWFTRDAALQLGIKGTVQNLDSGDVEVYATAKSSSLNQFKDVLTKGPSFGYVNQIEIKKIPNHDTFSSFTIISSRFRW